ncbi:hypothetical protein [Pseudooceanicola nitratireducens]|uniref:hypothetical protein n=1 Tax=Pseudooceanicola nitratireducens TaxID=517719 RepID=UPI0023F2F31B|nr:hypothetical protein [Pseudooceanicola nitratireducens]
MALASIKARIERLEAKRQAAPELIGVIGGAYGQLVPNPDKPGHLMFSQPPGGFEAYALKQQSDLQAQLRELLGDAAGKNTNAPHIVGTPNTIAPLPEGKKRPRYIEVNGEEIDTLDLKRN